MIKAILNRSALLAELVVARGAVAILTKGHEVAAAERDKCKAALDTVAALHVKLVDVMRSRGYLDGAPPGDVPFEGAVRLLIARCDRLTREAEVAEAQRQREVGQARSEASAAALARDEARRELAAVAAALAKCEGLTGLGGMRASETEQPLVLATRIVGTVRAQRERIADLERSLPMRGTYAERSPGEVPPKGSS